MNNIHIDELSGLSSFVQIGQSTDTSTSVNTKPTTVSTHKPNTTATWSSQMDIENQMRLESLRTPSLTERNKMMDNRWQTSMEFAPNELRAGLGNQVAGPSIMFAEPTSVQSEPGESIPLTGATTSGLRKSGNSTIQMSNRLDPLENCHRRQQINYDRIQTTDTRHRGKKSISSSKNF